MGKVVTDKLRPDGEHDRHGVAEAKAQLETAYGVADAWARESTWAAGDTFTLADCAAAPALFYANRIAPFGERRELARRLLDAGFEPSFPEWPEAARDLVRRYRMGPAAG